MSTARAMRRLKPDPLPHDLLEELVEAATWAPNGGNAQAYSWLVVTDREQMRDLARLWAQCYELYMATARHARVETMDQGQAERMYRAVRYQRDHFAETPALLVACYDSAWLRTDPWARAVPTLRALLRIDSRTLLRAALNARRAQAMTQAASIYPAVQNVLLTARARGLGATMTTWHLLIESEFKRALGIPRAISTYAVIPIGWPSGKFGPVRRRPAGDAIRWQHWTRDSDAVERPPRKASG